MEMSFILLCVGSFIAAGLFFRQSVVIDNAAEADRPEGYFVQAYVLKRLQNHDAQTARVTCELIVGCEKIVCEKNVDIKQAKLCKPGSNVSVVYNSVTKELHVNPSDYYYKKRNKYLAAAVALCMCGSFLAVTIYPVITWM